MKTRYTVALTLLAGIAIGAVAVQGLHAQAAKAIYYVGENDVTDVDGYTKEYLPGARQMILDHGGKYIAAGKATSVEGAPPASRVVLLRFESLEKFKSWRDAPDFKQNRSVAAKYAKFRSFYIEASE
jgi:uncharacterized protein (DUF1330 family)